MQPVLLGEYRNQNSRRCYPFRDDCTLTDNAGVELPIDFLIDAYLFPIVLRENNPDVQVANLAGDQIYVKKIDLSDRKIYIANVSSGEVCGIAVFDEVSDTAYVYEEPNYHRQIGVLVFGSGLTEVVYGVPLRVFSPKATAFTPTAYTVLDQLGVRGFLLEDGSLITGSVIIEGQDGISVRSYIDGYGNNVLKFDMVGKAPDVEKCADEQCPIIKTICVQRGPCSDFAVAVWGTEGNALSLTSANFTLDDICGAQKSQSLPDADGNLPRKAKTGYDPCTGFPVPPPPCTETIDDPEICIDLTSKSGNFFLVTPNAPGYRNAVGIKELDQSGSQSLVRIIQDDPVASYQQLSELTNQVATPPYLAGGITIYFKGIGNLKRK